MALTAAKQRKSAESSAVPVRSRRDEKNAATRQQLIESTIEAISSSGLHEATLTVVSEISGLSRGLVGYHFRSKEQMLKETLAFLVDEYRAGWQAALTDPKATPEQRLLKLIDFDLGEQVCSQRRVAVWYAFWGSVRTKRLYREVCLPSDREYVALIADQVRPLLRKSGETKPAAEIVAQGYSALIIGLWQQFNIAPEDFDRAVAKQIGRAYFRRILPGQFEGR